MKTSERKDALLGRVEQRLDLPVGVLTAAPRMELSGKRRIVVEGCDRVLECTDDRICLCTAVGTVRFTGLNLRIACRTAEHALITGQLLSLEFL